MLEETTVDMALEYVTAHTNDGRHVAAIPSLRLSDTTREANTFAHVAIAECICVATKQIELVQCVHDGNSVLSGFLPTIDGEADHAVTIDDIRTERFNDLSDAPAQDRIPASEEFVSIAKWWRKFWPVVEPE
jgi:hypothetical protein